MTDLAQESAPGTPVRYERTSTGLEFDRVAFFSDAVFAIAMTLLVVGIGIPTVSDAGLADALREKRAEITSFFISFVVIGVYWRSHHRFWAGLKAVDNPLIVREPLSPRSLRYLLIASTVPVVVFLGSIPIALHDTVWALYSWLLIIPLEWLVDRWFRPDDAAGTDG